MIAALVALTLTASSTAAAQSAESQYDAKDPIDCRPGQCPPESVEGVPALTDVPKKAGSSGSRSFRGFSETLGDAGSTGIPPAAAAENAGASKPSPDVGSDPAASEGAGIDPSKPADDVPESGATGDAKPENTKPRALPEMGGTPLLALGALAALAASGLLIRRIVR